MTTDLDNLRKTFNKSDYIVCAETTRFHIILSLPCFRENVYSTGRELTSRMKSERPDIKQFEIVAYPTHEGRETKLSRRLETIEITRPQKINS